MAQAANIVIPDGVAVNHTFIPMGLGKDGYFYFEDQTGPSPLAWNKIGLLLVKPVVTAKGANAAAATARIKYKILTPKLETLGTSDSGLTPSATISYVPMCEGQFVAGLQSTTAERKDIRVYNAGLMANPQFIAMVEQLVPVW